jgi:hypothetical protein
MKIGHERPSRDEIQLQEASEQDEVKGTEDEPDHIAESKITRAKNHEVAQCVPDHHCDDQR